MARMLSGIPIERRITILFCPGKGCSYQPHTILSGVEGIDTRKDKPDLEKLNQGLLIVKTNGKYDHIYDK